MTALCVAVVTLQEAATTVCVAVSAVHKAVATSYVAVSASYEAIIAVAKQRLICPWQRLLCA